MTPQQIKLDSFQGHQDFFKWYVTWNQCDTPHQQKERQSLVCLFKQMQKAFDKT